MEEIQSDIDHTEACGPVGPLDIVLNELRSHWGGWEQGTAFRFCARCFYGPCLPATPNLVGRENSSKTS